MSDNKEQSQNVWIKRQKSLESTKKNDSKGASQESSSPFPSPRNRTAGNCWNMNPVVETPAVMTSAGGKSKDAESANGRPQSKSFQWEYPVVGTVNTTLNVKDFNIKKHGPHILQLEQEEFVKAFNDILRRSLASTEKKKQNQFPLTRNV